MDPATFLHLSMNRIPYYTNTLIPQLDPSQEEESKAG